MGTNGNGKNTTKKLEKIKKKKKKCPTGNPGESFCSSPPCLLGNYIHNKVFLFHVQSPGVHLATFQKQIPYAVICYLYYNSRLILFGESLLSLFIFFHNN